jgi:hypothetical protein
MAPGLGASTFILGRALCVELGPTSRLPVSCGCFPSPAFRGFCGGLARGPLDERAPGRWRADRVRSIVGVEYFFGRIGRFKGGAAERVNLQMVIFPPLPNSRPPPRPPAPREATWATMRTESTTTGAPALEPEAADWNRANDHLKKKQGLTAEEDAAARSCAALASTARLRGQRRDRLRLPAQDQAHARSSRGDPAVARRGWGFLAQICLLFFMCAVSGRRRSRPRCKEPTPPPLTCAILLARSRDPLLALPAGPASTWSSDDRPEAGAPPTKRSRESTNTGPSHAPYTHSSPLTPLSPERVWRLHRGRGLVF